MTSTRTLLAMSIVFLGSAGFGQDVASGPEAGKKTPPLPVFDATGPNKDKDLDYAAERKDKPTVYLFVRADAWSRPMARFLKKLDDSAPGVAEDASVVAVWLTEDAGKTKEYLPVAQQSLDFQNTALTCFTGDKPGPKDWGINPDAHLTVVVTARGRVAKVFGYRSVNETDAPAVEEAWKKALAGK